GRRHIEDGHGEPIVVDWRAPVAIPFYRATAADPQGLALRRRFSCDGDELLAIFDEHLDDPDSMSGAGVPDPVLAEIERSRTGEMADIVATIAAEQDLIIRAPLEECLLVQGGPGTGKTAVGLHRAAYLLFEHRDTLGRDGVLVLGPNPVFLGYVANVLPSLGETAVTQTTITSLLSAGLGVRVRGTDDAELVEIKGSPTMAEIIDRIARQRIRVTDQPTRLPVGIRAVTLEPDTIELAQKTALAGARALNRARGVYTDLLVREAIRQLASRGVGLDEMSRYTGELRRSDGFRRLVDRTWPSISAPAVVRTLLGNRRARARAADGLIDADTADRLHRRSAKRVADEQWTDADLPLLDEAAHLCGGSTRRYGHVVIDEAQDLSAMALRAAGRRASGASMTVLGDIAQATTVCAQPGWATLTAGLGVDPARVTHRELTVGYRVPGPILELANRLLAVTAPGITPASSVRQRGQEPEIRRVSPARLVGEVTAATSHLAESWTSVGVIVADRMIIELAAACSSAGLDAVDARRTGGVGGRISLVDPPTAKGLEFDAVVVVEPSEIAAPGKGLRLLYVALTRAVQRLVIVHSHDLPDPLG
ncbi:MAG: HelD family protein, partial [Acidimicrobiales bacterium]